MQLQGLLVELKPKILGFPRLCIIPVLPRKAEDLFWVRRRKVWNGALGRVTVVLVKQNENLGISGLLQDCPSPSALLSLLRGRWAGLTRSFWNI